MLSAYIHGIYISPPPSESKQALTYFPEEDLIHSASLVTAEIVYSLIAKIFHYLSQVSNMKAASILPTTEPNSAPPANGKFNKSCYSVESQCPSCFLLLSSKNLCKIVSNIFTTFLVNVILTSSLTNSKRFCKHNWRPWTRNSNLSYVQLLLPIESVLETSLNVQAKPLLNLTYY